MFRIRQASIQLEEPSLAQKIQHRSKWQIDPWLHYPSHFVISPWNDLKLDDKIGFTLMTQQVELFTICLGTRGLWLFHPSKHICDLVAFLGDSTPISSKSWERRVIFPMKCANEMCSYYCRLLCQMKFVYALCAAKCQPSHQMNAMRSKFIWQEVSFPWCGLIFKFCIMMMTTCLELFCSKWSKERIML